MSRENEASILERMLTPVSIYVANPLMSLEDTRHETRIVLVHDRDLDTPAGLRGGGQMARQVVG